MTGVQDAAFRATSAKCEIDSTPEREETHLTIRTPRTRRVMRDAALLTMIAALVTGAPVATQAAGDDADGSNGAERAAEMLERNVEARLDAIARETRSAGRADWAGTYYEGDGLGTNVRMGLSPTLGVAASWQGCLGTYGVNLGRVGVSPQGTLQLRYTQPNVDAFGGFPDEVRPLRWGERRYLVPVGRETDFIAAMHAGVEPRTSAHGRFLLADGDASKPVSGLPELPSEMRARIRMTPVSARVTRVESLGMTRGDYLCVHRYRLALDVADAARLWPGETLRWNHRDGALADITATGAGHDANEALAVMIDPDCGQPRHALRVGSTLTTGAFDPVAATRAVARMGRVRDAGR